MAEALATNHGGSIDVVGHSYGGRTALGAALLTTAIGRVVCYEGAPSPPGASHHPTGVEARLGDGRIVVIEGARHAAHHTHPDAFADAIRTILT